MVIIGAGVIGCSLAYHLAKRGCRDVVVLEKESIGSGSTGRCTGGIRQQFSSEINIRLSMESVAFYEHFEEETGHPADFHQHGYLMLATSPEEMEAFRRNVALQRQMGLKVYLLSPQEAKEIIPQLNTEDVLEATYCPSDGYADPYSVVQGFACAARGLGVRVYEDTEVTGFKMAEGRLKVLTSREEFEAPTVVDAAGAYAALVARMAGVEIPIRPSRRHIFVTEPVDTIRRDLPVVINFSNGFWFRREGRCLIFGMRNPKEPEGFDTRVDWGFLPTLAQVATHRLPLLGDTGVMRAQAGLHEDTPDFNAIMGGAPGISGLFLACGFSGHGFMHSPAAGRVMAQMVLGERHGLDLSSLGPERFASQAAPREHCFI